MIMNTDIFANIIYWCDGPTCINLVRSSRTVRNIVSRRDLCRSKARRVMLLHNTGQRWWATDKHIRDPMLLSELLLRGANPNIDSGNPLQLAAAKGWLDSMEILLRAGAFVDVPGDRAMRDAIENDQMEAVATLLSWDVNIEGEEGDGQALTCATCLKKRRIVKFLLQMGANPNAQNGEALAYAASAGDVGILRLLIKYGADTRIKEDQALCEAAVAGHLPAVKFIFKAGNDAVGAARALNYIWEEGESFASDAVDYLLEKIYWYLRTQQGMDDVDQNAEVRQTFKISLETALSSSAKTHAFCQKWAVRLVHFI